jgi:hypothetical protein
MLSNGTGAESSGTLVQFQHLIDGQRHNKEAAHAVTIGPKNRGQMKTKDSSRKWMWWFLGVVLAMQLYFVRELLAAFALFVLGFGAIAFVLGALYLLHQGWAVAVESLASSQHPAVLSLKRRVNSMETAARGSALATIGGAEELAKRAIRRAGSATAR